MVELCDADPVTAQRRGRLIDDTLVGNRLGALAGVLLDVATADDSTPHPSTATPPVGASQVA